MVIANLGTSSFSDCIDLCSQRESDPSSWPQMASQSKQKYGSLFLSI